MLFDDDNNYFEFDDYNDIDFKIKNINFNRETTLYNLEEGFNKGNMFKNIYSKYKNYVYKLKVNNEKDKILYKVQAYSFALKDLTLYLDVHPNDESVLKIYKDYRTKLNDLKNTYEKNYGPLYADEVNSNNWTWINNPWPWDKGGNN